MIITGMNEFQKTAKNELIKWYKTHRNKALSEDDVFIVWSCKTLQNYKCLASTTVSGDGVYAEYTFNGDKQELYEDVYVKETNRCITYL